MTRRVGKLSAVAVARLTRPGLYGDGGGLWLQVKRGSRSWLFRYTRHGKAHALGLGPVHTVTLAEARARARECRRLLLEGVDPLEARRAAKRATTETPTFDECAASYIEAHRAGWRNAKHAAQWAATLRAYASPVIGALPVAEVDTAHVVRVLAPIWTSKTETATRLRGRIEAILDWARVQGYRAGENPARWRGHLDHLLADPGRVKRVQHFAALPWQDVGAFMADLRQQDGMAARALEFAILTACRSGEARGARWREIDFDAALWIVPAERMKAKREHRVPLSTQALALLRRLPRVDELVFPGRGGRPLSDMSLTAVLRRMGRDVTVHGFRSSFRDWAAEATAYPREVAEHALAHRLPDKTEAAYQRGDLIEKRRRLMQDWADFCDRLPAEVVPLRGALNATA